MVLLSMLLAHATPEQEAPLAEVGRIYAAVERFQGIELQESDGILRLAGTVPSADARTEAAAVAARVPGVLFLDNLLVVETEPPASIAQQVDDASTEARLRGIFGQVPELADVQVEVNAGVAHLRGTVLGQEHIDRAVGLVEAQPGIVFVENDLSANTDLRERLGPVSEQAWSEIRNLLGQIPLFVVAIAILALFWLVGSWLSRWDRLFGRMSNKPLLRTTAGQVVRLGFILLGALIALELLDATSLVGAVVGTAGVFGLAVGFAFQDIVENYLAGLLLSLQQPFSKDDTVKVNDVTGVVVRLTTRNTLLLSADGNHIYLPNADVFKSTLTNYSRNPHRRFDFAVGVGVEEDLREVISTGLRTLGEMDSVCAQPAPSLRIEALGDSSVVMRVYGWVDQRTHDFLAVRTEAIRQVKQAFDVAEYDMPEPIYRVTMTQAPTPPPKKPRVAPPSEAPAVELRATNELEAQVAVERAREDGDLLQG